MPGLAEVLDELIELVREHLALPEPPAGKFNVLTSIQASQRSFVEDVKAESVVLPCAVIAIGDDLVEEKGVSNKLRRYPASIHYMQADGPRGTQRTVHARLRSFRQAIDDSLVPFDTFFPVEHGRIRTDATTPLINALFIESKSTIIGGSVEWREGLMVNDED